MKTRLLTIATLGLCISANAQELKEVSVSKEKLTSTSNLQLVNQKKVLEAYDKLDKVYTLDFSNSKTKSLSQELVSNAKRVVRTADYVDYSNKQAINELLTIKPEALTIILPFKGTELTIDLVKANLFGDEFTINSNNPEAVKGVKMGIYYQGMIRGENTAVGFSFFENEFNGLITTNWESDRTIEVGRFESTVKSGGTDNQLPTHIIYSDDDLLIDVHHSCGSEALEQYQNAVDQMAHEDHTTAETEKAMYKCVTYFWETSYNVFQSKGSSQGVTNYMTSLFNNFQLIYNNEQIGSKLNQLYIWTTADSYANSLNTFSSTRTGFNANLATLFSTTGGGGVAWLNALCGTEYYKHGFCGSIGETFSGISNYSWPVNVTCHEVGHNLGSPHTHACTWTGGAIDGCGPAAGYNEGCTAAIPANGGTMMSYCHLTNVGVNLTLGFGPQPGNLIRGRVNTCLTLTCDENGNTGGPTTCGTAFEPNETQAAAVALTSGTLITSAIGTATDVDYFKITTSAISNITFVLAGPSGVDYDMTIYNSTGTQIGSGSTSSSSESVILNNLAAGSYGIKIFGYKGATSSLCYTLKATAVSSTNCTSAYEPNESIATAATIALATTVSAAIPTAGDNDYFKIPVTIAGTYAFNLTGPAGVDFDMVIYNSASTSIATGTGLTSTESVSVSGLTPGTYYARVYGYNGAISPSCYTLNVAKTGASIHENSNQAGFTIWPNPATDKLMIQSSDMDASMKVEVIDINGQILSKHQLSGNSTIDVNGLQSGVYFIRIFTEGTGYQQLKFVKQ